MQQQARTETRPELALRQALRVLGVRGYRLHRRALPGVRRTIDIAFVAKKVAVFVNGCFWHGCADHRTVPRAHRHWWQEKLAANKRRDGETDRLLREAGWVVVRVWEHDDPETVAREVAAMVASR